MASDHGVFGQRAAVTAALSLLCAAALQPAHAGLDAQQTLEQFNLVVIGNSTSTSHVDGRSFVGGSLDGGDYVQNGGATPASAYAGLTVLGDANHIFSPQVNVNGLGVTVLGNLTNANINSGPAVVQGNAANVNFNGTSHVGGSQTNVNQNGGLLSAGVASAAIGNAVSTDFDAVLTGLSTQLSQLGGNSFVSMVGNKAVFNASAVNGVAVFDLTSIDTQVFGLGEFEFNLGGATTVIINSDDPTVSIGANFLGGGASAIGARTIWNFYNAGELTLNSQFGGAVLATGAHLTNHQNIEGGVYVDSLTQKGEIHLQTFAGNLAAVPEPGAVPMMLAGLLALLGAGRRRRG
jgi:choice-of-anchor A domain-containing protein